MRHLAASSSEYIDTRNPWRSRIILVRLFRSGFILFSPLPFQDQFQRVEERIESLIIWRIQRREKGLFFSLLELWETSSAFIQLANQQIFTEILMCLAQLYRAFLLLHQSKAAVEPNGFMRCLRQKSQDFSKSPAFQKVWETHCLFLHSYLFSLQKASLKERRE